MLQISTDFKLVPSQSEIGKLAPRILHAVLWRQQIRMSNISSFLDPEPVTFQLLDARFKRSEGSALEVALAIAEKGNDAVAVEALLDLGADASQAARIAPEVVPEVARIAAERGYTSQDHHKDADQSPTRPKPEPTFERGLKLRY